MQLLVVIGSLRAASLNRQLAEAVIAELPDDVAATVFDGLADLPHFNEELEGKEPASVVELREVISAADALLLVTPEYNGSTPSALKNAIDWASCPRDTAALAGKPAVVMGASPSPGATKGAREVTVRALKVAGAEPLEETFGIAKAHESFTDGRPAADDVAAARSLLTRLLDKVLVGATVA